jgi:hypothetical protein
MSATVPTIEEHEALALRVTAIEEQLADWEPDEPEPEDGRPVLAYTDAHLQAVTDALRDPGSVQSKQWTKAASDRRMQPGFVAKVHAVIDSAARQQDMIDTSQAAHGLALRSWIDPDASLRDACGAAALDAIDAAVVTTTFVNSNYDGADGKLAASWFLPNFCEAMALMWDSVTPEVHQRWRAWLVKVGMDNNADTQRGGTVYDGMTGEAVRGKESDQPLMNASAQVGGSLLDYTGGANWQVGFDYAKLCIALVCDEPAILAAVLDRFESDWPAAVYLAGDEHPTLGPGWPWPPSPPPEGAFSQYDDPDEMAYYWQFANASVATWFAGLLEELGRDMSHTGMILAPAALFMILLANNGLTVEPEWFERLVAGSDVFAGVEREAVEQAHAQHGGNFGALESSGWLPTMEHTGVGASWSALHLGTRSSGEPDWKHSGSAADFPSFYLDHFLRALNGYAIESVTWLTQHVRVNDPNAPRSIDNMAGNSVPMWGNQMVLPALMFSPLP